jgi:hypothetical protein
MQKMRETILDNYHRATHINSRVIRNLKENRQRFNFNNRVVKHRPNLTIAKNARQKMGRKGPFLGKDRTPARNPFVRNTPRKHTAMRKQPLSPRITTTERSKKSRQLTLKRKPINKSGKSLQKPRTRGSTRKNLRELKQRRTIERRSKTAVFKKRQPRISSSLKTAKRRSAPALKMKRSPRTKQLNQRRSIGLSRARGRLL